MLPSGNSWVYVPQRPGATRPAPGGGADYEPPDTEKRYPQLLEGIAESLREDRVFSAAFYLKELAESDIVEELFVESLREVAEDDDLWWQVRALQELGWRTELSALLLEHADEIDEAGSLMLKMLLADARGDEDERDRLRVLIAAGARLFPSNGAGSLVITPDSDAGENAGGPDRAT